MGRPLRLQFPGAVYHVTARGNRRATLFADARDHLAWLGILAEATERFGLVVHGFCLMPNHYHMLVETPQPNISAAMHYLNGTYAKYFNWRYGFTGHVFQGRFHSVLVERDSQLLETVRYIALNPVRAELVARPGDWRWSSHRFIIARGPVPLWLQTAWVLEQFGSNDPGRRIEAYEQFVDAGIGQPSRLKRPVRRAQPDAAAPPLAEFASKYPTRDAAILAAHVSAAYSREQIARHFAVSTRTVTRVTRMSNGNNAL